MPPEALAGARRQPVTTPPRLASVQSGLLALITGHPAGLLTPEAETLVVSDARASADERVHVYFHMYRARLVEALESQFPRLARHLGPVAFAALAEAYVACEPSTNPSLRPLGARLPEWLERWRPETPWLTDLAHLEWARADVFDVIDEAPLTMDALRALSPDDFAALPLKLVAAHRLVIADDAISAFWDAIGTGLPLERPGAAADSAGETLIVWRQGTTVYHRVVDARELAALELLAEGTTFGALCSTLLGSMSEEAATAQAFTWLSTWIADELLATPALTRF